MEAVCVASSKLAHALLARTLNKGDQGAVERSIYIVTAAVLACVPAVEARRHEQLRAPFYSQGPTST
jgi:hypothetical protein